MFREMATTKKHLTLALISLFTLIVVIMISVGMKEPMNASVGERN